MEDTQAIQLTDETINIPKQQLEILLRQNKELRKMTFATTEIVLFAIRIIGGKIPTNKMQIFSLIGKLPTLFGGLQENDIKELENIKNIIVDTAPKYMNEKQYRELMQTGLFSLIEKQ